MAKNGSGENNSDISAEEGADKLVSRCGSEPGAFALLYDIYYEKIFSYCIGRVFGRQVAEDLTSTTFNSAAKTVSGFRGKTRIEFVNWLYAIATVKINAYLKKKKAAEKSAAPQRQDLRPDTITWPILHNVILRLKPEEQTAIALRFFENLTVDRIAEITNSKPKDVRLRIARAIENIKIFGTEKQFENAVKKLGIDNTPDAGHKERLGAKILVSFNSAGGEKHRTPLYSFAAAIVLITVGLLVWFGNSGRLPTIPRGIVKHLKRTTAEVNLPPQIEKSRLEKIKQLAAEKDIAGLLEILKGNDLTAKLLAAKFLAEITDSNTADIMKLVSPAEKPTAQKSEQQKSLLIRTIDRKTKQPLADVSLQIRFNDEIDTRKVPTDSNGRYLLALPAEPLNQIQVRAVIKGYAAMKMQRRSAPIVPEEVLFEMSPVREIGGLVMDEQLKPVEDAGVKVRVDTDPNSELPMADIDEIFKTDVNGIWRCGSIPQDVCQIQVCAMHPDYIVPEKYQSAIIEQLENLSFLSILEKGITITGGVFDQDKKPLQATVGRGAYYEKQKSVNCDANGVFRFDNISAGMEIFTAQCTGAAPQIQRIDVGPNMPPIVFSLEPAKIIRARVVDINSVPVEGVYVKVSSWQGFSSLNFEAATDANGFFRWTDAPADEVLFELYKPGYMRVSKFSMTSENDYVITLLPLKAGTDGFEGAEPPVFSPERGTAEYNSAPAPAQQKSP
ncbi:MAG: sigma-70 family RNA polymerase sigma factor [Phycisphaerae bacterium]|nr:sigma-70 family RNA polymerase sigma factor [Phycisphaerae bacterium]